MSRGRVVRVYSNGGGNVRIINPITGFGASVPVGSRDFEKSNSEYFTRSLNSTFNPGDSDFWVSAWCKFESLPVGDSQNRGIMALWTTGGDRAWLVNVVQLPGFNGWRVLVRDAADSANYAFDSIASSPITGVWYHVFFYHDAANNEIGISINGGSFDVTAHSAGIKTATSSPLLLGWTNSGGTGQYMDGLICRAAIGRPPSGTMNTLAATIRNALYNSGASLAFSGLSSAQKTDWGLTSGRGVWYELNEQTVGDDAVDSVAGLDMTDVNTVGVSADVP